MNLGHFWANRKIRRSTIATTLVIALPLAFFAFLRIWSLADMEAYFEMAKECHPVWKEFALRRFGAGDSAAELFRRFPPNYREEFGRYGVYSYRAPGGFTGLTLATRDGRLSSAETGSCTWQFTFFETDDPELDREYAGYYRENRERMERERLK